MVDSRGLVQKVSPKGISGFVGFDPDVKTSILLLLNGTPIAETGAGRHNESDDTRVGFTFRVDELWEYVGDGDRIQVVHNGGLLEIANHGNCYAFNEARPSRAGELLEKIDAGYVFKKNGTLIPGLTRTGSNWQENVFALYEKLRADLKKEFNLDLTITYGTLLGCVREQAFLKQDDDFDTVYISKFNNPQEVRAEALEIMRYLVRSGYRVWLGYYRNVIKVTRDGAGTHVDVFWSWFDDKEKTYQLSYGYHGTPAKQGSFGELTIGYINQRPVPIPANSHAILEQFYGPGWKVPDQGFSHFGKTRVIDTRYFLTHEDAEKLYWTKFYKKKGAFLHKPSPFAKFFAKRIEAPATIVDLGCGTGRDALFFAENGFAVRGFDVSPEGIAQANTFKRERGLDNCIFETVDAAHPEVGRIIRDSLSGTDRDRNLIVYCRFFLHSIPLDVEQTLLSSLGQYLRPGFTFAAEFRTDQDAALPKRFGVTHYRRFVNPEEFQARLEKEYGFSVRYITSGFGLALYKEEDPHVCRVIAAKV
jgi:SAM-dependent methyltransferase